MNISVVSPSKLGKLLVNGLLSLLPAILPTSISWASTMFWLFVWGSGCDGAPLFLSLSQPCLTPTPGSAPLQAYLWPLRRGLLSVYSWLSSVEADGCHYPFFHSIHFFRGNTFVPGNVPGWRHDKDQVKQISLHL